MFEGLSRIVHKIIENLDDGSRSEYKSRKPNKKERNNEEYYDIAEVPPVYVTFMAYLGFYILIFIGYINKIFFPRETQTEKNREGYPGLYDEFENFYKDYVCRRLTDGWEKPICSVPGALIKLKDRVTLDNGWTFKFTGTETVHLNLGSYNYLAFAENQGQCAMDSIETITKYGCSTCSVRRDCGRLKIHDDLEELVKRYLRVEDAITFGMGFATNSMNLASIIGPDCLVISDEKNHTSLILGLKLSGATIRVFKHNDMSSLEHTLVTGLKEKLSDGKVQWRKLFIVTEGIFSMEGTIVKLPELLAIKKKYKAYLYLDEAHSVGALGKDGRGVVDYFNCNPADVDIMMGTFAKSFGSAGGYIAGSKRLIQQLRANSEADCYSMTMPPAVAQQIITSMKIVAGLDGTDEGQRRIKQLRKNTRYFRNGLRRIGCIIYGHYDSPVVPMLVYQFSKIIAVQRMYSEYQIATVAVGFPATPLMEGRIRFCLTAGHTLKQLKYVLEVTEKIADQVGLRYSGRPLRDYIYHYVNDEEEYVPQKRIN